MSTPARPPARSPELRRVWPARPGRSLLVVGGFVVLLWVVQLVNSLDGGRLTVAGGIIPLRRDGLDGILFAPLLHGSWVHLEGNTLPVLLLGFLATSAGLARFGVATAVVWLTAGVGAWLTGGAGTVHVGASSLVFGWLTLLLARGFLARSAGQVALAAALFLLYGSVLWGVLPTSYGVSWQGHLFGAIGGVVGAVAVTRRAGPPARRDELALPPGW